MSYLVLARKWRPRTFSEVLGQEHVTATLKKAVEKNRLAHAYLFAGPRGCGKTTTARLLAKIVNCEHPSNAEPCNECPSCVAVNEGRHLDVIEIDGASNRGIDEIRDLREKLSYAPSQGRCKIYIIDEVHMLTPQAFNALLKTLEEPPPHVYLVFATTEPHKVPATILSRCQRFNFKRLELREIVEQLERICKAEKIEHEKEAIVLIARRADGSMRDAESLLDQCIAASDGSLNLELARKVLGLVDSQLVIELLRCIAGHDRKGTLSVVDRAMDSGVDLEEFFLAYIEGLRNLLVLSVEGTDSAQFLDLSASERQELGKIAELLGTENLLYLFRSAMRGYRDLKLSGRPRYQLEAVFTEAASWESAVELSELLRRLDSSGGAASFGSRAGGKSQSSQSGTGSIAHSTPTGRSNSSRFEGASSTNESARSSLSRPSASIAGASSKEATKKTSTEASEGELKAAGEPSEDRTEAYAKVDMESMFSTPMPDPYLQLGGKELWERFVAQVREAKLTLGIWLVSANVTGVVGDRIILSFSARDRFAREMIFEEKNRRFLEHQLERFFGKKLSIEAGDDLASGESRSGADCEKPRSKNLSPELEALSGGSEVLRKLFVEFDGELLEKDEKAQEAPEG